ncbi:MAG: hypothetical protein IT374_27320 [Polyangiaceae bacterium]|nr:hypothetical protein [Polyangiaceae bacterium]
MSERSTASDVNSSSASRSETRSARETPPTVSLPCCRAASAYRAFSLTARSALVPAATRFLPPRSSANASSTVTSVSPPPTRYPRTPAGHSHLKNNPNTSAANSPAASTTHPTPRVTVPPNLARLPGATSARCDMGLSSAPQPAQRGRVPR